MQTCINLGHVLPLHGGCTVSSSPSSPLKRAEKNQLASRVHYVIIAPISDIPQEDLR